MTIVQSPYFINVAAGQQVFTTTGTGFTFTVPNDVFFISAVLVGGGASGARGQNAREQAGSGGGGLRYINDLPVNPGETLTVDVGAGGPAGASNNIDGINGGNSRLLRSTDVLCQANGGTASTYVNGANSGGAGGTGTTTGAGPFGGTIGGGNGGAGGDSAANNNGGGGGAGGYSGNGGTGVADGGTWSSSPNGGSGGAGAGGDQGAADGVCGGGVGILGEGTSGGSSGAGGSGGTNGGSGSGSVGGSYGGGGGGAENNAQGAGGQGAVRIIWGPNRSFPSTNTADV